MSGAHLFGGIALAVFLGGCAVAAYRTGGWKQAAGTVGGFAVLIVVALLTP